MKKIVILFQFVFIPMLLMAQGQCNRCHGAGKIKTRYGMASYGVNNKKIKCQHCGQWIYASEVHWDTCPTCRGTGRSSSKRNNRRNDASSDDWMAYLTPQEMAVVNEIREQLKPRREYIKCDACNGSGRCKQCGGVQTALDINATHDCWVCQGSGYCIGCKGTGFSGSRIVDPPNKQQLLQRLAYYSKIASQRMHGGK